MDVVIVESPAKAKTINKYLGDGFTVLASYGHVRDLRNKDGSVRPDEDFAMEWDVDAKANKRLSEIAAAVKGADHLYLATDPDREGEAISWHVREVLEKKKVLKNVDVQRVVFHEITKKAVLDAIANPREIDSHLVDAYLARRALDYLVGFTLSPVLWRKLPGSRSAGRVQSVALRLICERESEIEIFKPVEYWSVETDFETPRQEKFTSRLVRLDGEKLDRHSLGNQADADRAVAAINAADFKVTSVERKETRRNPSPPFTTSTLQQEASRKLGLGASRTMRLAQELYEGATIGGETVGLITYMRTDSVTLSGDAIAGCRRLIEQEFGAPYLPESPRVYKTKAKNAQEAHEAIRPTDLFRTPKEMAAYLDKDLLRLYELIWKRTVACEMESAVLDQVAVSIESPDGKTGLRANGSVIKFDGFLKLYREDKDDAPGDAKEEDNKLLPAMNEGDALNRGEVRPEQHFTQPPPRYTEASLVKRLEELGIGRPSTYASIIQVLQDRDYVTLEQRRFTPHDRGRVVTSFLSHFFPRYVEYDFTANLEDQLDEISGGREDWKAVLREFWTHFFAAVEQTKDLKIRDVIDALDEALGPHFFPIGEDGTDPRVCPKCGDGRLGLKLGKFGGFIGCSSHPECKHTRQLSVANGDDPAAGAVDQELGLDPESGLMVWIKVGPYGPYVQLGEAEEGNKPKRMGLPKGLTPDLVDLDLALKLLGLPREVGAHPETGDMMKASLGRYGPYVQHGRIYASLPNWEEVFEVGVNRAVDLIAEKQKKGGGPGAGRHVGDHPDDGKKITAAVGRYGPYVKYGRTYASLPKDISVDEVTLDQAVVLINEKLAKKGAKAKPAAKKKAPAKKKPAKKKPAAKKKAAAKPKAAVTDSEAEQS